MRTISLCAGIEGIGLGLSLVLPIKPVLFVERDPFCQRVLAARYPGVPIGSDLFMAALAIWVERFRDASHGYVDLLTAGFPCQPWSAAGLRLGTEDDRWLWPLIAQWIRLVRPRYVFLENVPGLLSGGAGYLLGDLAAMGYDAAWGVFSCEALGASHRRQRVFILGYLADDLRDRRQERGDEGAAGTHARTISERLRSRVGQEFWAPGPDYKWGGVHQGLWPQVEPGFRGVVHGLPVYVERANRRARLRALGNSVSAPVAAVAWAVLSTELEGSLR